MGTRGGNQKNNTSICIDCANAIGGCSWSAIDPDTGAVKFQPVDGWTAEESVISGSRRDAPPLKIRTYRVIACPQFKPDIKSAGRNASALTLEAEKEFLEDPDKFLQKYGKFYR